MHPTFSATSSTFGALAVRGGSSRFLCPPNPPWGAPRSESGGGRGGTLLFRIRTGLSSPRAAREGSGSDLGLVRGSSAPGNITSPNFPWSDCGHRTGASQRVNPTFGSRIGNGKCRTAVNVTVSGPERGEISRTCRRGRQKGLSAWS